MIHILAFATPNSSAKLTWDSGSQAVLTRLVSSAKSSGKGTKIVLSVGKHTINKATLSAYLC